MPSCNDLFQEFFKNITLTDVKRTDLTTAREALRNRIRDYFKNTLKQKVPLFRGQGSFYIRTIVNPLWNKRYDIDDGVYLQNLPEEPQQWPSAKTVHQWICNAIDGHTDEPSQDRDTCIRAIYSKGYHVDLPIYGVCKKKAYLAVKDSSQWPESDPKALIDWFNGKMSVYGEQLRRLVCYIKAWGDYNSNRLPMLKGVAFTILMAEQCQSAGSDDRALIDTAKKISEHLKTKREIRKPVVPFENVIEDWDSGNIDLFLQAMDLLISQGEKAIGPWIGKKEASEIWRELFGDRFPLEPPDKDKGDSPKPSGYTPRKGESVIGGGRFA